MPPFSFHFVRGCWHWNHKFQTVIALENCSVWNLGLSWGSVYGSYGSRELLTNVHLAFCPLWYTEEATLGRGRLKVSLWSKTSGFLYIRHNILFLALTIRAAKHLETILYCVPMYFTSYIFPRSLSVSDSVSMPCSCEFVLVYLYFVTMSPPPPSVTLLEGFLPVMWFVHGSGLEYICVYI